MKEPEKIKSVSEYIEQLKNIFDRLKDADALLSFWFRGEGIKDMSPTPLIPNAYRDFGGPLNEDGLKKHVYSNAKCIEGNLKGLFHREAAPYLSKLQIENNSWNEYYLMQHYGLKTRLLDWTENALIALFNAVFSSQKEDGIVWVLNPHLLNKFTIHKICNISTTAIYTPTNGNEKRKPLLNPNDGKLNLDELYRRYLQLDFEDSANTDLQIEYFPLALYPPLLDERMSMQSACFTIFGNQVNGLCDIDSKDEFLDKVIIDANSKPDIKEELRWLGISQKNMLPGLEGICKSIKDSYDISDFVLKKIK